MLRSGNRAARRGHALNALRCLNGIESIHAINVYIITDIEEI